MTELEKLKAGLEYCYDDEEVDALKERAIIWCQRFNALDPLDFQAQRDILKENLGSMGKRSGSPRPSTVIMEKISISAAILRAITISPCWTSGRFISATM